MTPTSTLPRLAPPGQVLRAVARRRRERVGGRKPPDDYRRGYDAAKKRQRHQENDDDDSVRAIAVAVAVALAAAPEEVAEAGEGAAQVPHCGVAVVNAGVSVPRRHPVIQEPA